ncbi:MAG: restriction endonuclease subunit S [Prolixibacteraceae bacterium]
MEKELPKGWVETTIGDVADNVQYGYTASSQESKEGVRFLRITDIQENKVNWETVPTCIIEPEQQTKFELLPKDIVFARTGATVGKSFLINELPYAAVFASYLIRLSVYQNIQIKYVKYFFESRNYWMQISDSASGIGQPSVNASKLKEINFPLPPLPEQQRIVTKLDTLFGHLDALKTRLDRIPQLLKDFRQKVLTQAVTGKLTVEWREGKELSIEDYINELENERVLLGIKELDLPIVENELPANWVLEYLTKIAYVNDPNPSHRMPNYQNEGIPFISTENFIGNDSIDFSKGKKVDNSTLIDQINRFDIKKGTFALTRIGTIGKTCYLPEQRNYCLSHAVCIITTISDKICSPYLKLVVSSEFVLAQGKEGIQSVGVPDLGMGKIRNFLIPLPTMEEQQEIVRRVESLFVKADQIEASYKKLKAKIEQLPQALLAKAFRGELVEQLPTDGDARDLLEQIKQAKAGLEKGGKSRKMKAGEKMDVAAKPKGRYGK